MPTQKYLCLHRSSTEKKAQPPSPSQMQDMFASWNVWKDKFKPNILDMGAKLKPSGKVVTSSGVTDGPFVEAKEIVGGYMIISAESYDEAVEVAKGILMPGSRIEIRELGGN